MAACRPMRRGKHGQAVLWWLVVRALAADVLGHLCPDRSGRPSFLLLFGAGLGAHGVFSLCRYDVPARAEAGRLRRAVKGDACSAHV